jgi:DNA invertase Pin-like site-specific DNA recombinase
MKSIVYCRVSSAAQNEFNKSVSLQAQEQLCSKFAHENKFSVKSIFKEVHSAFNNASKILSDIINKKSTNIIISSVDRYSRSVCIGMKLANISINNNNKLIFIQEKFVCKNVSDLLLLNKYLLNTENESKILSVRIKTSRAFLISNGLFPGGYVPYGYEINDRKLIKNQNEHDIIDFIKTCLKYKILCVDLNIKMKNLEQKLPKELLTSNEYVPINFYDDEGDIIHVITEKLTNKEISELLNSYNILKRGVLWNPNSIKTAIKEYDPNNNVNVADKSFKIKNWSKINKELDNILISDDTPEEPAELPTIANGAPEEYATNNIDYSEMLNDIQESAESLTIANANNINHSDVLNDIQESAESLTIANANRIKHSEMLKIYAELTKQRNPQTRGKSEARIKIRKEIQESKKTPEKKRKYKYNYNKVSKKIKQDEEK